VQRPRTRSAHLPLTGAWSPHGSGSPRAGAPWHACAVRSAIRRPAFLGRRGTIFSEEVDAVIIYSNLAHVVL
jgi:hypothetical protein